MDREVIRLIHILGFSAMLLACGVFALCVEQWNRDDPVRDKPNAPSLHEFLSEKMLAGGIATLPHIMDRIEKGNDRLVPMAARLTARKGTGLAKNATRDESLKWWQKEKGNWAVLNAER